MMSRRWPGFSFLCVTVLLCLGNGAFASIDPNNLREIINYIRRYGLNIHYAVAVRLEEQYCSETSQHALTIPLPTGEMEDMKKKISDKQIGIYNPEPIGNIVAARPKLLKHRKEHAEWRLLTGGQNSPVERILANKDRGCLIFFSKLSPCTDRCLNKADMKNIVQMVNPLFDRFPQDFKAFVFETVYEKDAKEEEKEAVVEAWKSIRNSPLFRCYNDNRGCIKCFDNNQTADNPCLRD
ncbi:uncharacterized protein LOC117058743 [Lacerta agilis]|uniref:uncharacterized protein LOC117058743 n=1 Tax=Lacerta agilis TaxID=80427 RepID=UPI0014192A57|nr:uncharacterized protein LOC117058743 [Lacerta agilis]